MRRTKVAQDILLSVTALLGADDNNAMFAQFCKATDDGTIFSSDDDR